ncbi:hypothetical protein YC2023_105626 [Brassica napus]
MGVEKEKFLGSPPKRFTLGGEPKYFSWRSKSSDPAPDPNPLRVKQSPSTVPDSDAGQEPFSFQIGKGDVIKGWDEGVMGMQIGEVARLRCSPDYAYGAGGFPAWGIQPNSVLDFEIEVLSRLRAAAKQKPPPVTTHKSPHFVCKQDNMENKISTDR